jgi:UDP-2-acetamido-3-amino-2,3-dideoxy-glucuronate N-acetyltransferase
MAKIHPTAIIDRPSTIGATTSVWHFVHIRSNVKIGEGCTIGKGVYIDRDVSIGCCVKIQNFVSVYKGVTIENEVFIGPSVTFTNDLYPRASSWSEDNIIKTLVKKGASIGANATIVAGITIGSYAMVGAGSVVTHDVPDFALVYGNPARIKGVVCYCGNTLAILPSNFKGSKEVLCQNCQREILFRNDYASNSYRKTDPRKTRSKSSF